MAKTKGHAILITLLPYRFVLVKLFCLFVFDQIRIIWFMYNVIASVIHLIFSDTIW